MLHQRFEPVPAPGDSLRVQCTKLGIRMPSLQVFSAFFGQRGNGCVLLDVPIAFDPIVHPQAVRIMDGPSAIGLDDIALHGPQWIMVELRQCVIIASEGRKYLFALKFFRQETPRAIAPKRTIYARLVRVFGAMDAQLLIHAVVAIQRLEHGRAPGPMQD